MGPRSERAGGDARGDGGYRVLARPAAIISCSKGGGRRSHRRRRRLRWLLFYTLLPGRRRLGRSSAGGPSRQRIGDGSGHGGNIARAPLDKVPVIHLTGSSWSGYWLGCAAPLARASASSRSL